MNDGQILNRETPMKTNELNIKPQINTDSRRCGRGESAATEHREHKEMNTSTKARINREPREPRERKLSAEPSGGASVPASSSGFAYLASFAVTKTSLRLCVLCVLLWLMILSAVPASAATRYVWQDSPSPAPPYTNWATAAHIIQEAVDAADPGDTVLVTNGVYATGGRAIHGTMTNRVAVDKPLSLSSVNGPEVTVIEGYQLPVTTNGDGAIRCVYLTNGASLSGFTLTNGATRSVGDFAREQNGGGVWCESSSATASNCVLIGNSAADGGGSYQGTLSNCILTGNSASSDGGGAAGSALNNCILASNSATGPSGTGGGAAGCTLNNCTLTGNSAFNGGGAFLGTLNKCILTGNSAVSYGGGAWGATLNNCALIGNSARYGGGASGARFIKECRLNNCTLTGNSATEYGGGAYGAERFPGPGSCVLSNCVLTGNSARYGGGASVNVSNGDCMLNNCTLTGNSATNSGGGTYRGLLKNCIVYFNTAPSDANYVLFSFLEYSCTTPFPSLGGLGNITNAPLFVDQAGGDLRLQSNSPCINAGKNAYITNSTDLDGNPRIVGGTVDIGAYEFQSPSSVLSYTWAQQYGLPTDGSADYTDTDQDGHNNWQEWKAWTIPNNAFSVLKLLPPQSETNGMLITWQSVLGHSYFLERATNAGGPFSLFQANIPGQPGTTSFTDTNAVGLGTSVYRVGVQ
jgi:hypothetical protein